MAKAKHQKSKPQKQAKVKKHGKQADIVQFHSQLDALGVKVIKVTADGNCFFRALADQLEGNEEEHRKYRLMVSQYIMKHREHFEPFIEDDVSFDDYCKSMEKDGTWAGHMELQAASLVTRRNICIHQTMTPRWYIQNFSIPGACMIHLSYHDEEHYNSVRLKEDSCDGPAKLIVIKADGDLSATAQLETVGVTKYKDQSNKNITDTKLVKLVMIGSGCENADKIEQVLQELDGDIDAAIEFLIAEQEINGNIVENDELPFANDIPNGNYENEDFEQPNNAPHEKKSEFERPISDFESVHDDGSCRHDAKKIPRNKVCPCGSKKKFKACCSIVTRKPSEEFVIKQKVVTKKGRKDKQGRKGESIDAASSHEHKGGPPDMGALCI